MFQWYLGHSTKRKENRTYIHVTRLLAVRFSLLCIERLDTTPWKGCMNHDLATDGERQLRAGKSAERTKRNFRCPIYCSAIGHASCLICAPSSTDVSVAFLNQPHSGKTKWFNDRCRYVCSIVNFYYLAMSASTTTIYCTTQLWAERENGWGDRERISLFKKRPRGLIEKIP